MISTAKKIFNFYYEGFRGLTPSSKKLWLIIIVKLFIMFAVLKVFFFPDFLKEKVGDNPKAKSEYVGEQLTNRMSNNE